MLYGITAKHCSSDIRSLRYRYVVKKRKPVYRTVNLKHVSAHFICTYCLPAGELCYLGFLTCEKLVLNTKW